MIIGPFKNKTFPVIPTGFSEDEEPARNEDKKKKGW